jgi:hypothetical protein
MRPLALVVDSVLADAEQASRVPAMVREPQLVVERVRVAADVVLSSEKRFIIAALFWMILRAGRGAETVSMRSVR